ncbi:MAG: PQQ-binding-like beta-propeller repeat protein [Thermoleophilaceae bacterium]
MAIGRSLIAVFGTGLALVAAPAVASADWPVYGHDLSNTRAAGADGPSPDAVGSMKQAWTFSSSNGDFTATPVVAGGTLVAGTNLGSIYALDAVTGKVRWSRDVGQQINGSAAIDLNAPGGATVFVPIAQIGSPRVLALSLATGAVRWDTTLTRQDGADVFGSPTFWNGTLYMGTSGPNSDEATARGTVSALDEATGKMRWQTYTVPPGHDGGAVWSTPAIDTATGRLYVGTGNAYHAPAADTTDAMLVLDSADGRILGHFQTTPDDVWEMNHPTEGPDADFGASPNLLTGPDGRQLVGEGNKSGLYWGLDRATMKPVWKTSVGPGSGVGGVLASTAFDGTRLYGDDTVSGQVWALGRDGSMQWENTDGGAPMFAPVAIGHGVLYSVSPAGLLTARDASSGSTLAKLPLGQPSFGGMSVVGGAVYVATGTGPPPQPDPVVPDTSKADGSGSITAFGDTSRSGASPPPPAARRSGSPRGRREAIGLSVRPGRVQPGRAVRFRFHAWRGSRPMRGVTISLAGRRAHTDRRGRATLRARLATDGTFLARATRRGLTGSAAIVAGRGAGRPAGSSPAPPQTAAAARHPSTFSGRCHFTGAVHFNPPITNAPQPIGQKVEAPGTCSGTLVDGQGRTHDLSDAPVTFRETSQAPNGSCLGGTAAGTGSLAFQWSELRFGFSETRATAIPVVTLHGAAGGSMAGTARPAASQDPSAPVQQCGGSGMKEFALEIDGATTPSISG